MVDAPGQFDVVPLPAEYEEDRRFRNVIGTRYAALDVQLTGDDLARDEAFTQEHGEQIGPGHYRHRSLVDKLGEEGVARVRRFVGDVLLDLTEEGDRFVWFVLGGLDEGLDDEHSDDRLVLSGWVDEARINGSMVFFGSEREDVPYQAQRIGDYDRIRGLAGPGLSLARVLQVLTLACPIPTSTVHRQVGRPHLAALEAVLPIGRLFFEELYNGTRMRLVSRTLPPARMEDAVARARVR
jgi:hypothetical protein